MEIEGIKKIQLFDGLTDNELKALSTALQKKNYKRGDTIFKEGESGETLYIIKHGEIKVCKAGVTGEPQTLTLLKDGDICGEMSFLDGRPHTATLIAIIDTEVYQVERKDFESLIEKSPFLVYKVMRNIVFTIHAVVRGMNSKYMEMLNYMWGRRR
jgi:CRP/FNR family cyclic AMP-dependent transcriptional regulator